MITSFAAGLPGSRFARGDGRESGAVAGEADIGGLLGERREYARPDTLLICPGGQVVNSLVPGDGRIVRIPSAAALALGISLAIAYGGCAAATLSTRARRRHAAEFGCAESAVTLQRVSPRSWVATGCGWRAVYICAERDCSQDSAQRLYEPEVVTRTVTIVQPAPQPYVFVRPVPPPPREGRSSGELRDEDFVDPGVEPRTDPDPYAVP